MTTFATIGTFNGPNGIIPSSGLIADADGDLFGETEYGGAIGAGTVFEIAKTDGSYASTPAPIVSFNITDGYRPDAGLIADTTGDLFGTTEDGGANGDGTVFEIAKTAGGYASTPATLVSFNGTDGTGPEGLVADAAGDLFGTTEAGGTNGLGTVFEIAKTGGSYASTPTTLISFNATNGAGPGAGLIVDAAGDLFGTTADGGVDAVGTVFEIPYIDGSYASTPTTLVTFNGTNGADPSAGLIADADGDLFGTTADGGVDGDGIVFEIPYIDGSYASTPVTVASFDGTNGERPDAGLIIDAAGDLFGTTEYSADSAGTVFEIAKIDGSYVSTPITLFGFDGTNGQAPEAGLIANAAGDLFGTTTSGGPIFYQDDMPYTYGTVFELSDTGFQTANSFLLDGGNTVSYAPGGAAVAIDAGLGVSDSESVTLAGATVSIRAGLLAGDMLAANTTGTAISASYDVSTGVLSLSGSDTLIDYQQVLDSVSFVSTSSNPTNSGADPGRTVTWTATDGTLSFEAITSTISLGTVVGGGSAFLGLDGSDRFLRLPSGQLDVFEVSNVGALLGTEALTVDGMPLTIDTATVTLGAGQDYAASGDRDLFYRNAAGQLFGWQFNGSGSLVSNLFFTVGGAPVPIDAATTIIGAGEDYAASGDRDLFYDNPSGQLFGWQFDASGALAGNLFFTSGGAPLAINEGTAIIGAGEDYAGDGDADLFYQTASGQLSGWDFNASGALVSNLSYTVSGGALAVSDGTTIIGAGEDYAASGDTDLFYDNPLGQLYGWQFNASGALVSNLIFTIYGVPLAISAGTTIIGAGEDYAGTGDRDIFYRNAEDQLFGWQFNSSGALVSNLFFSVGGAPPVITGVTTIIGAGEDYAGTGDRDLFYRNASGQLFGWQFNASGALVSNLFFTDGGSPLPISGGTTIIGAGEDYAADGNTDLFYRSAAGQLFGWEFNSGGSLAGNLSFDQSGAPLRIASGTTVVGAGFNFLGAGGDDLFTRGSSGQVSVLEFDGSGNLTGSAAFPAFGNGDSAQVLVGTTGSDTLAGPAGASTLIGDGGTDTYVFAAGDTNELIINGVSGSATSGTLAFTTSAADINLWLDRVDDNGAVSSSGNNLRIDVLGTTTGVIIDDWFASGTLNGPLSSITAGGLTLDTQVPNLVQAMATFETGNPSFNPTTASPTITDPTVLTAVNTDWHH